ncbi:flagellar hook-length control protein FliK, partial [Actinoplanes octamycinicus]|uniref:flagellar hook-length control protein FliK n=1 Tax=Actinoplanes octamycinicus TaxID=135948 RepID=UPI0035EFC0EC
PGATPAGTAPQQQPGVGTAVPASAGATAARPTWASPAATGTDPAATTNAEAAATTPADPAATATTPAGTPAAATATTPDTGTDAGGDPGGSGQPGAEAFGTPENNQQTATGPAPLPTAVPAAAQPAEAGLPPGVPLPGVAGPQAAAPAAPAAPATPVPAPSTPMPVPMAEQLAMRIVPLRLDADGVHRLTVQLHPVDLGPVQVVAEIRNGDISVQLTGGTEAGTEAIRDALDDLRRDLRDAGFGNCSLDLRQGGQQDQARQRFEAGGGFGRRTGGDGPGGTEPPVEPAPVTTRRITPAGRFDTHA